MVNSLFLFLNGLSFLHAGFSQRISVEILATEINQHDQDRKI